ncbi:MAG TPA: hypothetical protein ENL45_02115 [Candidatus Woesearchaeota archaeon]|nr:hypothetical protein [Candidatus Woesearchaeota archaeon]
MLVKTNNKWEAVRAIINTLLKDQQMYCNWCGQPFTPWDFPCCENPQVGTHATHIKNVIEQNRFIKDSRKNEFASTEDKSLRWGISLPPKFFKELCDAFENIYGEKLLKDNKDLHAFMKEFPQFCVCEKV